MSRPLIGCPEVKLCSDWPGVPCQPRGRGDHPLLPRDSARDQTGQARGQGGDRAAASLHRGRGLDLSSGQGQESDHEVKLW